MSACAIKFVSLNGSNRRLEFISRPDWETLASRVAPLYDIPVQNFALSYRDEENDIITINTEEELQLYYATHDPTAPSGTYKFTVVDLVEVYDAANESSSGQSEIAGEGENHPFGDRRRHFHQHDHDHHRHRGPHHRHGHRGMPPAPPLPPFPAFEGPFPPQPFGQGGPFGPHGLGLLGQSQGFPFSGPFPNFHHRSHSPRGGHYRGRGGHMFRGGPRPASNLDG